MGTLIVLFIASILGLGVLTVILDMMLQESLLLLLLERPLAALVVASVIVTVVIYFYLKLSDKNKALEKRLENLEFQLEQLKKKVK